LQLEKASLVFDAETEKMLKPLVFGSKKVNSTTRNWANKLVLLENLIVDPNINYTIGATECPKK
jgi:hypothetical protein